MPNWVKIDRFKKMKDVQKDAYSASKAMLEIIIILLTYVHTIFNLLGLLKFKAKMLYFYIAIFSYTKVATLLNLALFMLTLQSFVLV